MIRFASVASLALVCSGCYAFALPPSRSDIGSTVNNPGTGPVSGLRVQTGMHSASAHHDTTAKFDVGAGYVYERTDAAPAPMPVSSDPAAGRRAQDIDEAHGAYAELSRTVTSNRHHRAWLGVRSEVLWHDGSRRSLGVSSRLSWELFGRASGSGSEDTRCGFAAAAWRGTSAIGVFVETGARVVEDSPTEMVATAGVSLRLPLIFAFGMDLCSWCR